jgi:hypothetical protein
VPTPVRVGRLRWPVQLLTREQAAAVGTGITETASGITVHADVQALGPILFYGAVTANDDKAPTHRIVVRWVDYVDMTHAVTRTTNRPDGSQRIEVFRVRRSYEVEGRKRFVCLECQLETAQ